MTTRAVFLALLGGTLLFGACSSQEDCSNCDGAEDGSTGGGSACSTSCATGGDAGVGGSQNGNGGSQNGSGGGVIPTTPCGEPEILITEIDLGEVVDVNEDEVALKPLAISPKPSGGSRLAYMGGDGNVHVAELDAADQLVGTPVSFPVHDFADIWADDAGGVILGTRDAEGGGTLNCGNPANLCGTAPNPAVPCFDMVALRFDGSDETWATKLTSSSAALPPYSTSATGPSVYMIWWYAHHGRLASDGENVAAYYGAAISVAQDGCINIHQGDRMNVLAPSGALVDSPDDFAWGCSHSGYEHVIWDEDADRFVAICKTDNQNRIAFAPSITTISPVDLAYSNLSDHVKAEGGGYWVLSSDAREGEPALSNGIAELHLLHFTDGLADRDVVIAGSADVNARAPHLARYGDGLMVATWETSSSPGDLGNQPDRAMHLQVLDASDGTAVSEVIDIELRGNRYQAMRSYPDGSVAYPAPGSANTKVKILRVLACAE